MRCSSSRIRAAERLLRIVVQHRHRRLQNNRAGIQILVDKMHRAAADLDAMFQRLMLRVEAGERGQQRRMDIQRALWEFPA